MIIKTARHINNVAGYLFVFENKLLYPEFLKEKKSYSSCFYYYWWSHFYVGVKHDYM